MTTRSQPKRVVIDSDAANEIDDQFAIAWALRSPDQLRIEAVHAAPFSHGAYFEALAEAVRLRGGERTDFDRMAARMSTAERKELLEKTPPRRGMERSFEEIRRVFEAAELDPEGRIRRGAAQFMEAPGQPVESEAVENLIDLGRSASPQEPIHVAVIGAPTNVASALLLEPTIARNLCVIFLAGFPSVAGLDDDSFNLVQDRFASNTLFESDVPLVYIPGYQVAELLQLSLPAAETWLGNRGQLADFLLDRYRQNPINPRPNEPGRSWVLWDMIATAFLLNPLWVPTRTTPRARVTETHRWEALPSSRGGMHEAYHVKRNDVFSDFFAKLDSVPGENARGGHP